jgi:aldose 1-epimerase
VPLTYGLHRETRDGYEVLHLADEARRQRVHVVPQIGATCIGYTVTHRGHLVHIVDPPPDMATLARRPTGNGNPILFPFPNRIRKGTFLFEGVRYEFDDKSSGGNHIHGLVYHRPWAVEEFRATPEAAVCAMALVSTDHEDIGRQYPFPFRLRMEYALRDGALAMAFAATNIGEGRMPMGVGFHPYFRCPISPLSGPSDCVVTAPGAAYWELDQLLPTGRILPVSGDLDLRNGRPFEGMRFDHVFTALELDPTGRTWRCSIKDRGIGLRTVVESAAVFRELVIYTPPGRRAICFEPYTCPTDAPNLAAQGLDVGLVVLEPGETFHGMVRVYTEPAS